MAPIVGVNHAPTTGSTEGSSEASAVSSSISAPVLAAPKQLGYTPGPEIPPTVSNRAALAIIIANY